MGIEDIPEMQVRDGYEDSYARDRVRPPCNNFKGAFIVLRDSVRFEDSQRYVFASRSPWNRGVLGQAFGRVAHEEFKCDTRFLDEASGDLEIMEGTIRVSNLKLNPYDAFGEATRPDDPYCDIIKRYYEERVHPIVERWAKQQFPDKGLVFE